MKKSIFCFILIILIAMPGFSQIADISDFTPEMVSDLMDEFTGNLGKSLPFNSSLGLNWSDASIGKFPHFGVGFALGFSTMELGAMDELVKLFAPSLPSWLSGFGGFPIPGYSIEARLGGFVIPFDIGFKFGYLPFTSEKNNIEEFNYFNIGGDIRISLFDIFLKDNEKLLNAFPKLSFGIGYNHLSGGLGLSAATSDKVYVYDEDNQKKITVKAPQFNLDWETNSMDFTLQLSKKIAFFTPYFGIGLSNGWSSAGYSVKTEIEDSEGNLEAVRPYFEEYGIMDLSEYGFSSSQEFSGFSSRLFTGFSLAAKFVIFDFTYLYNFIDKNYGVSFGIRVQM